MSVGTSSAKQSWKISFLYFSDIEWRIFSNIPKYFQRVGETAFYEVIETFSENCFFFLKKNLCFPSFPDNEQKLFSFFPLSFGRGCRNCILRVQRNTFSKKNAKLSFLYFLDTERRIIFLLPSNFQRRCNNGILLVCRYILRKQICFLHFFGKRAIFLARRQNNPIAPWKLHFTCPWDQFEENFFFAIFDFYHFGHWAKKFWPSAKLFRWVCRNCILRVHRKIFKRLFFFKIFIFFQVSTRSANLSACFQTYFDAVFKTAFFCPKEPFEEN